MKVSIRPGRRSLAVAAIACGAVTLPVSALAAPGHPHQAHQAGHALRRVHRCLASSTAIWLGLGNGGGTAGTFFYPLEFSNVGRRTCWLFGYPRIFAVSDSGRRIGLPAVHSGARHLVILRPGSTAHVILGIIDAGNISGCHVRTGAFLKVFAPGQKAFQIIPGFNFTACTNKSVLRVDAVHPGTGIPGFSTS
ncbi:MAG TPA: DUF4232 domain-containing protein [Streptosporangiaceae bacterium]|nr:DUF4232 domain-containing protein [Streptosporangiaceae bacterium]